MESLYNQLLLQFFLSNQSEIRTNVTGILKIRTCYFDEKWGSDRSRWHYGGRTNAARGIVCVLQT